MNDTTNQLPAAAGPDGETLPEPYLSELRTLEAAVATAEKAHALTKEAAKEAKAALAGALARLRERIGQLLQPLPLFPDAGQETAAAAAAAALPNGEAKGRRRRRA